MPFLILCIAVLFASCVYENELALFGENIPPDCGDLSKASYQNDLLPIISANCYRSCHIADVALGGVVLDSYNDLKFYANNGLLVGTITHTPGFDRMPFNEPKLPECQIQTIVAWVNQGAPNN